MMVLVLVLVLVPVLVLLGEKLSESQIQIVRSRAMANAIVSSASWRGRKGL